MKLFLVLLIMVSAFNVQAGTYTTESGSFNLECSSDRPTLLWLARNTIWKASNVCWLCFTRETPLSRVDHSAAILPRALAVYAQTIATAVKSNEDVNRCVSKSLGNIRRLMSQTHGDDSVLVEDYYQEVSDLLTPCVCN